MTRKRAYTRDDALRVAMELRDALAPMCEKIEIAGSLRRRKPLVSDVELLFIPKFERRRFELHKPTEDFFDTVNVNLADEQLNKWLSDETIAKRLSKIGVASWGKENKLGVHVPSGIAVDFFSTDTARWFVALVVRTGGKVNNTNLAMGAQRLGRKLHAYGEGIRMASGVIAQCDSEQKVFELCGVPYREPWERL